MNAMTGSMTSTISIYQMIFRALRIMNSSRVENDGHLFRRTEATLKNLRSVYPDIYYAARDSFEESKAIFGCSTYKEEVACILEDRRWE